MEWTEKTGKPATRADRRRAAWGKRLGVLALILTASMACAQVRVGPEMGQRAPLSPRITSELNDELSLARQGLGGIKNVRVIVQYKASPRSETLARVQNKGGRLGHRLDLIKSAAFTVPVNALAALENDPEVAHVSVDHPVHAMDEYTNAAINASTAWTSGYTGAAIGIAVIDSGINNNYDFFTATTDTGFVRVRYHEDFSGTANYMGNPLVADNYGHGTHVAGIIAGDGYMSGGAYKGVAPGAYLIDLRALDQNGIGTDSSVIAAIQEAIALKSSQNIKIINLSLGRGISESYANDPLCQAVESAWKAGIVVVVAAGNYGRISVNGSNGYGTVAAPGNDPFVITVGAMKSMDTLTRTDDQIASYSSKGPTTYDHIVKPDIVAPGNEVVSIGANGTLKSLYPGNILSGYSGNYFSLSGTSMATPAVTGAVALLLQQTPNLTPDQIKARLMKTAYKTFPASSTATDPLTLQTYTSYYDLFTVGSGYLDIAAALANKDMASNKVGSALSPTAAYNSTTGAVTPLQRQCETVPSSSVIWGTSVVWGTSLVWGIRNVNGSSVILGELQCAGARAHRPASA